MAGKEDLGYYQAHPELLKEYKDNYLVFGGHTKLDSGGDRGVAYLVWGGGSWILCWDWLEDDFDRHVLLVRARKLVTWPLDELEINGVKYRKV